MIQKLKTWMDSHGELLDTVGLAIGTTIVWVLIVLLCSNYA